MAHCQDKFPPFPHIIKVEASAGSGKTYALARRYIQLLINPRLEQDDIPLETILAITFTNKAAIEMKERILDLLKRLALDKFRDNKEKEDILSSLGVDEDFARAKAHKIMDCLMQKYNFFQVQTIDSFINAILCGCAFKLGLSANFKVKEEYVDYLSYGLDKLIDRASYDEGIRGMFHNFLLYYLFVENRAGWFPKKDILSSMFSLFSQTNKCARPILRTHVEAQDLLLAKKKVLELMSELQKRLPEKTNATFIKGLSKFLENNPEGFDIDRVSSYFKRDNPPVNKGTDTPTETKELWDNVRMQLKIACESESAAAFNYYIAIFEELMDALKDILRGDDVLFLEALNKEAYRLFSSESFSIPELYYRLACRFKHFLVDEFQDTSILQWENLFIMVEEALAQDGSLFYVGDKKQAIYRFRGGEVSLIEGIHQQFGGISLKEDSLSTNYRSRKEIVEFNNKVFSEENLKRFLDEREEADKEVVRFSLEEKNEILKVFSGSQQQYTEARSSGYVFAQFMDYRNREDINVALKDKILRLIESLHLRFSYKDIAILARKNEQVELLTAWLLEKDIPVESDKTLNIKENAYIKEIVSFLRFLNSPIDNLAFASFILGDIFLKASGLEREEIQDFIFRQRDRIKESMYLYRAFHREFPDAWNGLMEEFFKSVGFVSLYELLISIFSKFKVVANFYAHQGFFMRFLELVKEEEDEHASLGEFLEFLDTAREKKLYVNVTEDDAVKVLTIHKAKGLEFPAVIIPFFELNVKVNSEVIIGEDKLNIVHLKEKYTEYSSGLAGLFSREYLRAFIDELNSIYVALTRPKEELYVFVPSRTERGFNPASLLLPENNFANGKKSGNDKKDALKTDSLVMEIPACKYKDWIPILRDEFTDAAVLSAREEVRKGEVLHYILSFISNLAYQDKSSLLKEAIVKTKLKFAHIRDFQGYIDIINNLLGDKDLRVYFEVNDGEVFQEKEIVDVFGNTKRIDRLIVKPKEAWVIDYKSSRDKDDTYTEQVKEYMRSIRDIYPDRKIKGTLIYLDKLDAEQVVGQVFPQRL